MRSLSRFFPALVVLLGVLIQPINAQLTYNNFPLGSENKPLVMRTFMPEPGLKGKVLAHHRKGKPSPKYSPSKGKDIPGNYQPVDGLPAAIGVNHGQTLSYCWDTVECRLLYAWRGGFLDMTPYWGDPKRGNRRSFGYVPKLMGEMFYMAQGEHPIGNAKVTPARQKRLRSMASSFRGYSQNGNSVTFTYFKPVSGLVSVTIKPSKIPHQLIIQYKASHGKITYSSHPEAKVKRISDLEIVVTITGKVIKTYHGATKPNLAKDGINAKSGEKVFKAMGCMACHSTDGAKSHGPTLKAIHGSKRKISGAAQPQLADDAYLLESITKPNAKVVEGFPPNYMPPYQLSEDELKALLAYLKTL